MTQSTHWHEEEAFTLIRGDCVEAMKKMPDNSVDSIVTDPPYELGFMAKKWDGSGIAFKASTWAEAFRVLKPGGHLVAFSGTRTYHRMACAIEDAGFDIRDQLAWVYGSGFPKSLDVSKAIDASDKIGTVRVRSLRFTEFMRSTGITARQINEATDSSMASHYLTGKEQPEVATEEMFSKLRPIIAARGFTVPEDIEQLVAWRTVESENMKRRRVIGTETMVDLTKSRPVSLAAQGIESAGKREVNITAAHTEAAKKWEGWGTALKPAWEPIVLARKPLEGTVADNVLKYGTGALNVDGCAIIGDKDRWPANLCHDGSPEVVEHFPDEAEGEGTEPASAARFFYCAKASGDDRDEGIAGAGDRANIHPTVKPTELMRWLARLVTPPGGRVLDPFNGSGSTGKACMLECFHYTGIDLDDEGEYLPIAKARIQYAIEHKARWEQIHAAPAPTPDVEGQITFAL